MIGEQSSQFVCTPHWMFTILAALFKENTKLEKLVATRTIIFSVPVEDLESNGLLRALARSSSLTEFAIGFFSF